MRCSRCGRRADRRVAAIVSSTDGAIANSRGKNEKALRRETQGLEFFGGRYWDRTSVAVTERYPYGGRVASQPLHAWA